MNSTLVPLERHLKRNDIVEFTGRLPASNEYFVRRFTNSARNVTQSYRRQHEHRRCSRRRNGIVNPRTSHFRVALCRRMFSATLRYDTKLVCYPSIYLSLFVEKAQKHNVAITYSGQKSETTVVLNSALNT